MSADEFGRCKACGQHGWMKYHKCPPLWQCRIVDQDGDDWGTARGLDPSDAAEEYAKNRDECEHELLESGSGWIVEVRIGSEQIRKFEVTAEASVEYYTSEVTEP